LLFIKLQSFFSFGVISTSALDNPTKSRDPNHMGRYQDQFAYFIENGLKARNEFLLIRESDSSKFLIRESKEKSYLVPARESMPDGEFYGDLPPPTIHWTVEDCGQACS